MASIKVKFRPSSLSDREGRIFYQIIHDRKTRHIPTDYRLFPHEWSDDVASLVIETNTDRTPQLNSIQERIKCDIGRLERIIRQLESKSSPFTTEDIIAGFQCSASDISLFNEIEKSIARLSRNEKTRTSQAYATTLRSFRKYRQDCDILLDDLCTFVMEGYQA